MSELNLPAAPLWSRSYNEAIMQEQAASVGLCLDCVHAKVIQSDRGSAFYLCRLSATDREFPKYPRLPVRICRGYENSKAEGSDGERAT